MNKLFDLSYEQRRENFVRCRFGESYTFGNKNIKEWLSGQRLADKPNLITDKNLSDWRQFLKHNDRVMYASAGEECGTMEEYASAVEIGKATDIGENIRSIYEKISFLINPFPMRIFCGLNSGPVVNLPDQKMFIIFGAQDKNITMSFNLTSPVVMDIILAEWNCGRPKAESARQFLSDSLDADIAKIQKSAEADFDGATAVSADGKKILYADYVVVLKGTSRFSPRLRGEVAIYDSSQFSKNKILLTNRGLKAYFPTNCHPTVTEAILDRPVISTLGGSLTGYDQILCDTDESRVKIFFTKEALCEILPKGGIEDKVPRRAWGDGLYE